MQSQKKNVHVCKEPGVRTRSECWEIRDTVSGTEGEAGKLGRSTSWRSGTLSFVLRAVPQTVL
jgi:hypothetical protein